MSTVLAIFAHPDDIEFVAAGTLLMLQRVGWDVHYMNLCTGNGGSVLMDGPTTARKRLSEAQAAAQILGASFHPPISDDLELTYSVESLRKVTAVVRQVRPTIVLTHAPSDYMEDHMAASRLAVSGTFARGVKNFLSDPDVEGWSGDTTVYHALPHGLRDPLRQRVLAGAYVNTTPVQEHKKKALAAHESQKNWLEISQGMDSYVQSMNEMSLEVGRMAGVYEHAEGWRRHLHLGFCGPEDDPLKTALGADCHIHVPYEDLLEHPLGMPIQDV